MPNEGSSLTQDDVQPRVEDATCVVLRPMASPLPLAFFAFGVGSIMLSAALNTLEESAEMADRLAARARQHGHARGLALRGPGGGREASGRHDPRSPPG